MRKSRHLALEGNLLRKSFVVTKMGKHLGDRN